MSLSSDSGIIIESEEKPTIAPGQTSTFVRPVG